MKQIFKIILLVLLGGMFLNRASAERLVTDLSENMIAITSQFNGAELMLFGAIDKNIQQGDGGHGVAVSGLDYDVVVIVKSSLRDFTIRKKENMGGIWANGKNYVVSDVPGYYVVGSTTELDKILSKDLQKQYKLGIEYIPVQFEEGVSDADQQEFRQGLLRNMETKGLFFEENSSVSIKDETLFKAKLHFPANMPVGQYDATVFLVRDGEIIAHTSTDLHVDKTGIERMIYNFAHEQPAFYGLMAIFIAVFFGWFAGFVTHKMS